MQRKYVLQRQNVPCYSYSKFLLVGPMLDLKLNTNSNTNSNSMISYVTFFASKPMVLIIQ